MTIVFGLFCAFIAGAASAFILMWVVEQLEKEERRIKAETWELSDKTSDDILREFETH